MCVCNVCLILASGARTLMVKLKLCVWFLITSVMMSVMMSVFNVPFLLVQTASSSDAESAENGIIDQVCIRCATRQLCVCFNSETYNRGHFCIT